MVEPTLAEEIERLEGMLVKCMEPAASSECQEPPETPFARAHRLAAILSHLPTPLATAARTTAAQHFARLEAQHGRTKALSVLAAGLAQASVPAGDELVLAAPLLAAAEGIVTKGESFFANCDRDDRGHCVAGSGGGGGGDSEGKPASEGATEKPQSAREKYEEAHTAWEKEVAAIDAKYEKEYAAWEQAVADLDAKADQDYDRAYEAWSDREAARADRQSEIDTLAQDNHWDSSLIAAMRKIDVQDNMDAWKLLTTPEGRKEYRDRAEQTVKLQTEAFAKGFGEVLPEEMATLGFPEKSIDKIKGLASRGEVAIQKAGTRYVAAVEKYLAALDREEAWGAKEPEEPEPFEVEENDPDYAAKEAAWDKAYAKWEEDHNRWEEKDLDLSEASSNADDAAREAYGKLDEIGDAFAEKVSTEIEKAAEKLSAAIDKEQESDLEPERVEPEYPEEPDPVQPEDYPEEPEEPDEDEEPEDEEEEPEVEEEDDDDEDEEEHSTKRFRPTVTKALQPLDLRQDDNWDCGPTALETAARSFGIDADHDELVQLLDASPQTGTAPEALVAGAEALGLLADAHAGMTIDDLRAVTDAGGLAICAVQMTGDGTGERQGHYVTVYEVSEDDGGAVSVYVQDPSEGPKRIGRKLFERRWHDVGADGTEYVRWGLALSTPGGEKATRPVRKSQPADASGDADFDPVATAEAMADVLGGLLGEDALLAFETTTAEEEGKPQGKAFAGILKWDALQHPRGAHGRFIPKGSAEAVSAAKAGIDEIRKLGEGGKVPEHAKNLAQHLSILTVKQLHELKKEYGLKASGKLREQLVAKLLDRLPGAQARIDAERKEAAKKLGLPAEATMRDIVEHVAVEAGYPEHFISKQELEEKLDELGVSVPVQRGEAVRAAFEVLREGVGEKPKEKPIEKPSTQEVQENLVDAKDAIQRWHVTPHGEAIAESGFRAGEGNGIGGPVSGQGVSVWKTEAEADRFLKEVQSLEKVRVSNNPLQEAETVTGQPLKITAGMARLWEQKLERPLTDRERAVVHAQSILAPYIPATSFFGDEPERKWEKVGLTIRPGAASKITNDSEELYDPSDIISHTAKKPKRPSSAAPSSPKPPEPGFTGTDSLGRRWENGKLVAKPQEEKPAENKPAPAAKTQPQNVGAALEAKFPEDLPDGWEYRADLGVSSHGGGNAIARNQPGDGSILVGDGFFKLPPGSSRDSIVFHELGHSLPAFSSENSKETLRLLQPFMQGSGTASVRTRYDHPSSASGYPEEIVSDIYSSLMSIDRQQQRSGIQSQDTSEDEPNGKYRSLERHILSLAQQASLPVPEWFRNEQR